MSTEIRLLQSVETVLYVGGFFLTSLTQSAYFEGFGILRVQLFNYKAMDKLTKKLSPVWLKPNSVTELFSSMY